MSQGSGFFSNEQLLCLRSQIMVFRTLKACHFCSGVFCRRDVYVFFGCMSSGRTIMLPRQR